MFIFRRMTSSHSSLRSFSFSKSSGPRPGSGSRSGSLGSGGGGGRRPQLRREPDSENRFKGKTDSNYTRSALGKPRPQTSVSSFGKSKPAFVARSAAPKAAAAAAERDEDTESSTETSSASFDLPSYEKMIIYEDPHIIVLNKPPGMLSQGDLTEDASLFSLTKEYLAQKRGKDVSSVYLGLVHRLDRVSSGVLVLAKRSKAAARLSETLRTRQHIQKHYVACVVGEAPSAKGTLEHLLYTPGGAGGDKANDDDSASFDTSKNKTRVVSPGWVPPNGDRTAIKFAQLHYSSLGLVDEHPKDKIQTLLHVQPVTGRKHQIRAQLSHVGVPIVWDTKYGEPARRGGKGRDKAKGIALHALALVIPHPADTVLPPSVKNGGSGSSGETQTLLPEPPMVFTAAVPEIWGRCFGERTSKVCNELATRLRTTANRSAPSGVA